MSDLDRLGRRHRKLLADLDALRPELAEAIRAERAKGATYHELLIRSGYTSMETVRQILDPQARDRANRARRSGG